MASFETVCVRIFTDEAAWRRVLFGGLLCLSIVGIPWAAGYLFCYGLSARNTQIPALPEWKNIGRFWRPGWHFLAVFGLWYVIPLVLAFLAGTALKILTLGILWWGAYILIAMVSAITPALCIAALAHYQTRREWSALWELSAVIIPLRENASRLILPSLTWVGLTSIFLPLLPCAFFLGFTVLVAYYISLFTKPEQDA